MTHGLHKKIVNYWLIIDELHRLVSDEQTASDIIRLTEKRLDQLEANILEATPVSIDELIIKFEFIGRLVLQSVDDKHSVSNWFDALGRDLRIMARSQPPPAKGSRREQ